MLSAKEYTCTNSSLRQDLPSWLTIQKNKRDSVHRQKHSGKRRLYVHWLLLTVGHEGIGESRGVINHGCPDGIHSLVCLWSGCDLVPHCVFSAGVHNCFHQFRSTVYRLLWGVPAGIILQEERELIKAPVVFLGREWDKCMNIMMLMWDHVGMSKSKHTCSVLVKVDSVVSVKPCLKMGFHKGEDWTCDIFPGGSSLTLRISTTDRSKTKLRNMNPSLGSKKLIRATQTHNLQSRTHFLYQRGVIQKSHHVGIWGPGSWRPAGPWGEIPAVAGPTSKK